MSDRPQPWMDLVLAVDAAWGIGRDNALPWPKLSADLRHFKDLTSNAPSGRRNAVIMGRLTWESKEVARRALPRRFNVVLSRRPVDVPADVLVCSSLDAALDDLAYRADLDRVFIIGGAEIYRLALSHPRCRDIYLTRIAGDYHCDAVVPDLDERYQPDPSWPAAHHREHDVDFTIEKLQLRPQLRT